MKRVNRKMCKEGPVFLALILLFCLFMPVRQTAAQTVLDVQGVAAAANSARVTVRSGRHGDFSRLVFEWPELPGYQVENRQNEIMVRFDGNGVPDLSAVQGLLPKNIRRITPQSLTPLVVAISTAPGTEASHFQIGSRLVVRRQ